MTDEEVAAREERDRSARRGAPAVGRHGRRPRALVRRGKQSRRTSLIVDPPDGRIPSLTAEAKARAIDPRTVLGFESGVGSMGDGPFNGPEDLHLADRCITRGLPNTWVPSQYNNGVQFVQNPDYIAIFYEASVTKPGSSPWMGGRISMEALASGSGTRGDAGRVTRSSSR